MDRMWSSMEFHAMDIIGQSECNQHAPKIGTALFTGQNIVDKWSQQTNSKCCAQMAS